jgi:hypothetical protein
MAAAHSTASTALPNSASSPSPQLEDAPAMARDRRLDQLRPPLAQALEGPRLILLHEAAVADDIGGENGR